MEVRPLAVGADTAEGGDLTVYAQVTGRLMLKLMEHAPAVRATRRMAQNIAMRGGALSRTEFHDPASPYCDAPAPVRRVIRAGSGDRPLEVTAFRPCRRCEKCLQFRQMVWRDRALNEIANANRTWMVTLTFDPVHLAGLIYEAQEMRGPPERALDRAAYGHVQKYFKRLRQAALTRFRYLAVFEEGEKTGRPHYHVLLHEVGRPISKRTLEDQWRSNVHCRLVASGRGSASYVTKYATKSLAVRLRASARYGQKQNDTPQ